MLNKKSAFKPKAAIRRPPGKGGSQNASRPSTTEPSYNSTPVPQEPSSLKTQSAPHPATSTSVEVRTAVPPDGALEDIGTSLQGKEKHIESGDAELGAQATGAVLEGRVASLTTAVSSEKSVSEAAASQLEKTTAQILRTAQERPPSGSPAVDRDNRTESRVDDRSPVVTVAAAVAPTNNSLASAEPLSTIQIDGTTTTTTPTPIANQASTPNAPTAAPADRSSRVAVTPAETPISEQAQPASETAPEPATNSSQTAKPKRGRKRTTTTVAIEDAGEQDPSTSRKRPRKRAAPLPGEEGHQPAARRETRSRKRSASAVEDEEVEEDGEEENAGQHKKKPPRPQREATPPDAEAVEIDITQVKMADLAKDMHIGKKFSLHDELMERERAKRLRYNERRKRQQTGEEGEETAETGEAPGATPSSDLNNSAQPTPSATDDATAETPADSSARAPIGETYQIIDGEIVLDHRSLQVDRHARAREEAGDLVEIEENDFTHHTTSATYLRRNLKPQQWTDDETDLFYQALQAFGTDFDTICRMFRGKTRKHIKLKFNREERVNPQRITAALVGQKTVSFDMEQYQRATGQEYETAEAIYAEQKKAEEEFEARQKVLEDEKADEVRRKKEEVLAQLNSAVDGEGPKKGGRKGRKKKGPVPMGL
ncbi:hypothetical protein CHGG_03220 [Chaetomium globosum CBS 148.51]|uniref:Myb-like domain-containing protein n=1 Tax=Chaetomium globosum (strain ATCC 6205 / CBS 148.51 / DSM 1962 / NBRC 6347 / NRRL 1970) TaxID=306901 RepID=Q2H984_CHAGB|nr:uncharacterized protein CHGG_03220 [Chaetomium globosum CBS 148.51]EAQ91285.1 hypothetical protein CHGG_03220 [Chaetomium globosum CBS 148.51]